MKSQSGRGLHFRVTGSTHRSAFAFILTSETRLTFSLRRRRHALSVLKHCRSELSVKGHLNGYTVQKCTVAGAVTKELHSYFTAVHFIAVCVPAFLVLQTKIQITRVFIHLRTKSRRNERGRRCVGEN